MNSRLLITGGADYIGSLLVSFLTKKWNDCKEPIIHENLGYGVGDHGDPLSKYSKKNA